jgi:hypothetical protein
MFEKITITLDRERELRLDFNAMSEFENLTGNSLFTIGDKMQEARNIRALLFVCMKSANEDVTLEQVGSMLNMGNFDKVNVALNKLMTVSYGDQEETDSKKK